MAERTMQQNTEPNASCCGPSANPMTRSSIAAMCQGTMERAPSAFWLLLPGAMLIALGVLIAIEPGILVWLAAGALVLFGIMLLVMAYFMRSMGSRARMRHRAGEGAT